MVRLRWGVMFRRRGEAFSNLQPCPRAVINDDAAAMASTKTPKLSESLVDQTLLGDWARATNFEVAGGGPSPANSARMSIVN